MVDFMNELNLEIENILLEFAGLYNDLTTSDLQGLATIKADEIIKIVTKDHKIKTKAEQVLKEQGGSK